MKVVPHLPFDGQCEKAFQFYEKALGGKIETLMRYADSPMMEKLPPEWKSRIIHGTINIDGQQIAGADAFPNDFHKMQGSQIILNIDDPKEGSKVFLALSQNAKVAMPMQETFWAASFGMMTDKFGIPWMINCSKT